MMGWQWHQLNHMQAILHFAPEDNHASTSSLEFLRAGCPSCRPTNSVKALKANIKIAINQGRIPFCVQDSRPDIKQLYRTPVIVLQVYTFITTSVSFLL